MATFIKIPVIVILGHIDHGKSTLLEAIKKDFKITERESGGITQHIGAYEIDFEGKKITFIDTPGHEAFSEMRLRGAKVADIAILVVAADEGVKPQTKEAIETINKAKIPMIVVLNKIDKEGADLQKVKGELQKEKVLIEEWGGDVPAVEVSAKERKGIKNLLSTISVLAEISEVKSDFQKEPRGVIIESYLDNLRGPTATLILEEGKLKVGDIIRTETSFGKIKTLEDWELKRKDEILPGEVGVITGFEKVPEMGESFKAVSSIKEAEKEVIKFKTSAEMGEIPVQKEGVEKTLNIVLRADVKGSLEAISKILRNIVEDGIGIKILKSGVGEVTDSDIRLAEGKDARVIGFRVKPSIVAQNLTKQKGEEILTFDVIYDLIDGIRKLMRESKERKRIRTDLGKIKTLVIFKTQKRGERNYRQIVGGRIQEGEIKRGGLEIEREGEVLIGGKVIEIQEQKRKIDKARAGQEIGILYEGKTKIKEGDILIIYEITKK